MTGRRRWRDRARRAHGPGPLGGDGMTDGGRHPNPFPPSDPDRHQIWDILFRVTEMNDIDIAGDHAVSHEKFDGSTKTAAGEVIELEWQTLYKMLRVDGEWKIASFVGYMPLRLSVNDA